MGSPAQQPVYYDTEQGKYYTINNQQKQGQDGAGTIFGNMFGNMFANSGMPNSQNPFYQAQMANRNYLGSPYGTTNPDRFTTNAQATPYAELTNLFPSLNNNTQSLLAPTDTQSSGAGRFIAPSNTSQGK